jgi:hypothetical protein
LEEWRNGGLEDWRIGGMVSPTLPVRHSDERDGGASLLRQALRDCFKLIYRQAHPQGTQHRFLEP